MTRFRVFLIGLVILAVTVGVYVAQALADTNPCNNC